MTERPKTKRSAKAVAKRPSESSAVDAIRFADGSENVFADLVFPDAAERLAKAEMARTIILVAREKQWNQRRVATELGVAASDVSDLFRGKLDRFSQERLERFLNALDLDIRIVIGPRPYWKRRAGVTVERVGSF